MKFLFFILLSLTIYSYGQDSYYKTTNYKGDTVEYPVYNEPTICDCYQANWKNKAQKKICSLNYDYDFMSEDEKINYDKKLEQCKNPSICDCANASPTNKGMLKSCDEKYNYKGISIERLKENVKLLAECPQKKEADFSICNCLNTRDIKTLEKCNTLFFGDSISSEQQQINNNLLTKCLTNKDYDIEVSTCDCALFSEEDAEYKKKCDEKIEDLRTNKRALTAYLYSLKVCRETALMNKYLTKKNIEEEDLEYSICKCNEERLDKKTVEKCNTIWNYKAMTKKEQIAFSNTVKRCNTKVKFRQ